MTLAYVSIGSNIDRHKNVRMALSELRKRFGDVSMSPVYDSPAVGFDGPPFINLSVSFFSDLSIADLVDALHDIEQTLGRDRDMKGFVNRTVDLDLILYGDAIAHDDNIDVPRGELLYSAHVLKPLIDLQPDLVHPETGTRLTEYWQNMTPAQTQVLTQIALE